MITVSYVNYDYCEEVAWGIVMTGWASGLPDINTPPVKKQMVRISRSANCGQQQQKSPESFLCYCQIRHPARHRSNWDAQDLQEMSFEDMKNVYFDDGWWGGVW